MVSKMARKLVYGIGINDCEPIGRGGRNKNVFLTTWRNMLKRCYCHSCQLENTTYAGVTVCQEWLTFSNFKKWMERQDWQCKELDKDILSKGNKIYSPDACVFVDKATNGFVINSGNKDAGLMIGVCFHKKANKYLSQIRNPFLAVNEYLGLYDSEASAHQAWRKRKHELALQLADLQTDPRVAQALRTRYL